MSINEPDNNVYRSLFEGSQASLADMAARQGQALSRVGRLRQSIVTILRKNYGPLVNSAEMSMGRKINDVDDEILLAYLQSCVSAARGSDQSDIINSLKEALIYIGVPLHGDDPLRWLEQIREHKNNTVVYSAPSVSTPVTRNFDATNDFDTQDSDKVNWTEPTDTSVSVSGETSTLGDLFGDYREPVLWEGALGDTTDEPTWAPSPVKPAEIANLFDSDYVQENTDSFDTAIVTDSNTAQDDELLDANSQDTTERSSRVLFPAFKPEVIPVSSSSRKNRKPKTKALEPGEQSHDEHASEFVDIDEQVRASLVAAITIPRPVFTRDLISVAGSEDIVDAWEMECRLNSENNNIRFVAPKSRHRLRGRLVAFEREADPKPGDWWGQAVHKYRAGRLYELGVLLHRVGEEVVSYTLNEDSATFHLNTPKGLVGIVMVLTPTFDDASSITISADVLSMMSERLVILAILTASGEKNALPNLLEFVKKQTKDANLTPLMPVVAAKSWEYTDDRGSSAILIM